MFFKKLKQDETSPVTTWDTTAAALLAEAVKDAKKVQRPIKLKVWAKSFASLRSIDQIPEDRILGVLNWYSSKIGQKYIPQAFSGRGFRDKFLQIEAAMIRDVGEQVVVSDLAKKITRNLFNQHWPKISESDLAKAVQQSLDGYDEFHKKLQDYLVDTTFKKTVSIPNSKIFRFAAKCVGQNLSSPQTFVEWWFVKVHQRVRGWEEWSGDISQFVFNHHHKMFRNIGRDWATEYCGEPDRWDKLMEKLE